MKIYTINFDGIWLASRGLVILAENETQALEMAKATIKHDQENDISIDHVIEIDNPKVILYLDGDN